MNSYTAARLDADTTLVFNAANAPLKSCVQKLVQFKNQTVTSEGPNITSEEFTALAEALKGQDALVL